MRIGSAPDVRQQLLLMLATARREPVLIRRRKRRPAACEEFQRFCDEVAARAEVRGLTEGKLAKVLAD